MLLPTTPTKSIYTLEWKERKSFNLFSFLTCFDVYLSARNLLRNWKLKINFNAFFSSKMMQSKQFHNPILLDRSQTPFTFHPQRLSQMPQMKRNCFFELQLFSFTSDTSGVSLYSVSFFSTKLQISKWIKLILSWNTTFT